MAQYRQKTQRNILRTSSLLSIDVYSAGLFGCKIRASDPKGSQTNECALWLCQTKGSLFLCFRCSSPLKSCYKKKTFARIQALFFMPNSRFIMFLVIPTCKAAALTECYRNVIRIQKKYCHKTAFKFANF